MALQTIRIGAVEYAAQYDDGDFPSAIETTQTIKAGSAVDPNDVVVLGDIPVIGNAVSALAVIADHSIVRGDGGVKAVQDSLVIISDTGGITIPNGLTIGCVAVPAAITIEVDGDLLLSNRLGLGITPAYDIHIQKAASPTILLDDTTNNCLTFLQSQNLWGYVGTTSAHGFRVQTNSVNRIGITSAGVTNIGDAGTTNYASFLVDGELNLAGTARVLNHQTIDVSAMKRGVGSPPGEGLKDGFPTLDFDDAVDEEIFFSFKTPSRHDPATDMSLHIMFFVDTAPVGAAGVAWAIEWKATAETETIDFTAGTTTIVDVVAITTGTPANDAVRIDCEDLTGGAGAIAAHDFIQCRLYRDVSDAGDTFVGDVRLIEVHVHYTSNKLGTAT